MIRKGICMLAEIRFTGAGGIHYLASIKSSYMVMIVTVSQDKKCMVQSSAGTEIIHGWSDTNEMAMHGLMTYMLILNHHSNRINEIIGLTHVFTTGIHI